MIKLKKGWDQGGNKQYEMMKTASKTISDDWNDVPNLTRWILVRADTFA